MANRERVTVLYDTPPHLNDKTWLTKELIRVGFIVNDIEIHSKATLTRMYMHGGMQKIASMLLSVTQAIRAIARSHKGEYVLCWNTTSGNLVNAAATLLHLDRRIVCMNWLTPEPADIKSSLRRLCAANPQVKILVNHRDAARQYRERFEAANQKVKASFYWFPDVYDDQVTFKTPSRTLNENGRFQCFTGGMNNRDWKMIVEIAKQVPEVDFACVCLREDWNSKVDIETPSNIRLYENLSLDEYYRIMGQSSLLLLPLVENRASGIINIIRCVQEGHLCCVTRYSFTEQYFSDSASPYLMDHDKDTWIEAIRRIEAMSEQEYRECVLDNQLYIQDNYSPKSAGDRLYAILNDSMREL